MPGQWPGGDEVGGDEVGGTNHRRDDWSLLFLSPRLRTLSRQPWEMKACCLSHVWSHLTLSCGDVSVERLLFSHERSKIDTQLQSKLKEKY